LAITFIHGLLVFKFNTKHFKTNSVQLQLDSPERQKGVHGRLL
jgi:hypothetical protein